MTVEKIVVRSILMTILISKTFSFESQFLGNYLSVEEYEARDFCSTKVCILDNDRLIYAATSNSSIKPCEDFKNFAMGEFLTHRVPNDRYHYIGFQNDVERLQKQRQRVVLKSPIASDDPRLIKLLKSFFVKCSDLDHIGKHGADEIVLSLMNFLGNSPFAMNGSWNDDNFQLKRLFEEDSFHTMLFFTNYKLSRCVANSRFCFTIGDWTSPIAQFDKDAVVVLNLLSLTKSEMLTISNKYKDFIYDREGTQNSRFDSGPIFQDIKIKDLSKFFPEIQFDWLKFVNNQLRREDHLTAEDEINFLTPEGLRTQLKKLSEMNKKDVADIYATSFLYQHRVAFVKYFFTKEDSQIRGTKQSIQRFEQCIDLIEMYFLPVLDVLMSKKYFNQNVHDAAKDLATEVVKDAVDILNDFAKKHNRAHNVSKAIETISNMKYAVMFTEEVLNETKVFEIYENVEVDGNATFADMLIELVKNQIKLDNKPENSWITNYEKIVRSKEINYFEDQNILYIPLKFTLYPFYHPNRSRFFNMATLYKETLNTVWQGIRILIRYPLYSILTEQYDPLNHKMMTEKSYLKWEGNGGKELQLSAFKMSNRQMLWLSFAHRETFKHHRNVETLYSYTSHKISKFLHIRYKHLKGFKEAFGCDGLTEYEKELYELVPYNNS